MSTFYIFYSVCNDATLLIVSSFAAKRTGFALCYGTVVLSVLSVCLSITLVYCRQTVEWIKMPLGTELGLGSGDIVLDGHQAAPWNGVQQPPHFSAHAYCGQTAELLLWPPYEIQQAITFLPCGFYLSSIFFSGLISAAGDWMSTILPHMVWP